MQSPRGTLVVLVALCMIITTLVRCEEEDAVEESTTPDEQERGEGERKGSMSLYSHFAKTGERLVPHRANRFNSVADVVELQKTAPPRISFRLSNFGLRNKVTHLANITFANNGKDRGSILVGLFGQAVPRLVANFRAMIDNSNPSTPPRAGVDPAVKLVGSRCVRFAPKYVFQCGDLGPTNDTTDDTFNDTMYRVDDGVEESNWDEYLAFVKSLKSKAALLQDRDEDGTIPVEGLTSPELRHQIGTLSMVVRDKQRVGSHFFMSATPTGYEFDGQHVPIGVILGGFTTTLQTALLTHIPIDRALLKPRDGSEVTVSKATIRRFAGKGTTLYFEQRDVDAWKTIAAILDDSANPDPTDKFLAASQTILAEPAAGPRPSAIRDLTAGMNAGKMRGWLLPIPGNVRGRIYQVPETEAEKRARKTAEQRAALDSFNSLVQERGLRRARQDVREGRKKRRASRGRPPR